MARWLVGVAVAIALVGCGGENTGVDPDGGVAPMDAQAADAGPGDDASTPGDDASLPKDDASAPGDDASTPGDDASTPEEDGGTAPADASTPADASVTQPDGGTAIGCARCRVGEYCATPDGMCDAEGTCTPIPPGICPGLYDPVCGCDGTTYSNACVARAAGQSIAHDRECPATPDCRTEGCARGETCQACRGAGGAVYVCLPRGVAC